MDEKASQSPGPPQPPEPSQPHQVQQLQQLQQPQQLPSQLPESTQATESGFDRFRGRKCLGFVPHKISTVCWCGVAKAQHPEPEADR